jgi:hypothetical protein
MSSWEINPEFFSTELQNVFPELNMPEKQLKGTINLLHSMGFSVGLDVIPHTDRFSEMVLAYPCFFEWVRQRDGQLVDHGEKLWREVERTIYSFFKIFETADGTVQAEFDAFYPEVDRPALEESKSSVLFGAPDNYGARQQRRIELMRHVIAEGFETLPMAMAPPYRSLHINANHYTEDGAGHCWYQYEFDQPQGMSRVFGSLTRYQLFHSKDNNQHWELDFERPIVEVWDYVARQFAHCQQQFNFDFMRGDMTHVQICAPRGYLPACFSTITCWLISRATSYVRDAGISLFLPSRF